MKQRIYWFAILLGVAVGINFIIELISRKSVFPVLSYIIHVPVVFLLNTLVILLPLIIVYATKRKFFLTGMLSIIWLFLGSVNGILLIFRTTPFTAADFRLVKYALNMASSYFSWTQMMIMLVIGIVVIVSGIWLWRKAPIDAALASYQAVILFSSVTFIGIIGLTEVCLAQGLISTRYGNIEQAYQNYGFAYCFSNSIFHTGIPKPVDYGEEVVATIEAQELVPEDTYLLSEYQVPNIIMIQLESFFDPSLWSGYQEKTSPIPFFNYLKKTYPSGYLSVPSVGAGTANTEFECITGMNLDFFGPGEYPYKTVLQKTTCESIAFDLKNLGYSTHAIHNNEGTFYDRHLIFSQLGFDTFTPIEYFDKIERNPMGWCKDNVLTDEIIKTLDTSPGQEFIYTISVQGHGAYPDFAYYCEQIEQMDQFIRELITELNQRKEPTVVVFYGDHLPGFSWNEEEMENKSLFQTEYVIWNNLNLPNEKKDLEAYQLAAHLLDLLDIHEGTMMRFHQKYLHSENPDDEAYLADMEILEYDILYGDRKVYDGNEPFTATQLQMGIMPVYVDQIVYQEPNLLIFGENFNSYSVVCINGRPMETMYAGRQLLIVKDVPEKVLKKEITVKQIGRDKVPLGIAINRNTD